MFCKGLLRRLLYFYIFSVAVLVSQTTITLAAGSQVVQGRTVQTVTFDLQFSPSSRSIGDVTGSGLWRVDAFFSSSSSGLGTRLGETEIFLTASQGQVSWIPPSTSTITSLQGSIIVNQAACSQMSYLCARIGQGRSPSVDFSVAGDPTSDALLGCSSITCLGMNTFNIFIKFSVSFHRTLSIQM